LFERNISQLDLYIPVLVVFHFILFTLSTCAGPYVQYNIGTS